MNLRRTAALLSFVTCAAALIACSDATRAKDASDLEDDTRAARTASVDAELSVTPSPSEARLEIASGDGACATLGGLLEWRRDDLKALCSAGEVALPLAIDHEGCELGEVKKITFGCFVAKHPAPPAPGVCAPLVIKGPAGSVCDTTEEEAPQLAGVVCPGLGGLTPPPPPPDRAAVPVPPVATPVPPGALPPAPPPIAPKPGAGHPLPRLECCAPPVPPPGAPPAPPAPPAAPPAPPVSP